MELEKITFPGIIVDCEYDSHGECRTKMITWICDECHKAQLLQIAGPLMSANVVFGYIVSAGKTLKICCMECIALT